MQISRRWNFGFGTIFSLIVVYFIYLYSKDKGWGALAFLSKWYLIIVGGIILVSIGIIIFALLFALAMFLIALLKMKQARSKNKKNNGYIEAEFKVKG